MILLLPILQRVVLFLIIIRRILLHFRKFCFQIGEQFSKEYIVAFLSNTLGFWYPNFYRFSYIECDNYSTEMFMQNLVEPLERKSLWNSKSLINIYRSLCYSDLWREMPIVRLFFAGIYSMVFTIWNSYMLEKRIFFKRYSTYIFTNSRAIWYYVTFTNVFISLRMALLFVASTCFYWSKY